MCAWGTRTELWEAQAPLGCEGLMGGRFWCLEHRYVCAKGRDGNGTHVCMWKRTWYVGVG